MGGVQGTQMFRNVSIPHACAFFIKVPLNPKTKLSAQQGRLGIQTENCRNPEPG